MKEDIQLIKQIKRNQNRGAAEKLISKYYDEIYRYVYRQWGHKENAMDITQDIFISVLKSIYSYDHKKSAFRTYLYRIATNKMIDAYRKNTPDFVQFEDYEEIMAKGNEEDILKNLFHNDLIWAIEEYIRKSPSDIQQIFRLHVYAGYTFVEIADMQNLSEGTVKSKFYRFLKKIREEFKDEYRNTEQS